MPRSTIKVVIPKNPDDLIGLAEKIIDKHTADGAASVIPNDIATELGTLTTEAKTLNELQKNLYRDAENSIEQRNLALGKDPTQDSRTANTVLFYIVSARDVLGGLYRNNLRNLGHWGFKVNSPKNINLVVIPRKNNDILELAKNILAKHAADGAASPLPTAAMTTLGTLFNAASLTHQKANEAYREAEDATEKRNKILGLEKNQNSKTSNTVLYLVSSVRTLLLGLNRGNEQALGHWGFTVNTSAPVAPPPPPPNP